MKNWIKLMMLVILPAVAFVGCDDDDEVDMDEPAMVMVVHASPNAPGVDLLVDNAKVNTSALTFPNNTAYLNMMPGNRNIKVNAAGTSTSVIDAMLPLQANQHYTIFAANTLEDIEAIVLTDDLTAPASGKAHVRIVHLSPDAPAVDVAVTNGPVLFNSLDFKEATAFAPVDAGTYDLEVRVAGTETVALAVPDVQLAAGKIYTVYARGYLSPPSGNTNSLAVGMITNN